MLLFWLSSNRGIIIGKGTSCLKAGPRPTQHLRWAPVSFARLRATDTPTHMHIHRSARVYTHTYTQTRARTHTQARVYIHTYTHKRTCTHTHTPPQPTPLRGKTNKDTHTQNLLWLQCPSQTFTSRLSLVLHVPAVAAQLSTYTDNRTSPSPKRNGKKEKWRKPKQLQAIQTCQWRVRYALREFLSPGSLGIDTDRWEGWGGGYVGWSGERGVLEEKEEENGFNSIPQCASTSEPHRTAEDPVNTYSKATYNFVQTSLKATGLEHTSWHHKRWSMLCGNRSFDYFKSTRPFCYGRRKTVGFSRQH